MQNHPPQRRELPTAIVLLVSAFALFAFSLAISTDAGPAASSCPSCGLTAGDLSGHKCSPTPLTPKQLATRKHEAHALSDKSQSDWRFGSSDGVPASDLSTYIKSKEHLIALGKGLFWDQRVGSDDRTACATCHYHAGVDTRTRHTDTATNPDQLRFNYQWRKTDDIDSAKVTETGNDRHSFGLIQPKNANEEHQTLIIGSQGIRPRVFLGLEMDNDVPAEKFRELSDAERLDYHLPPKTQDRFRQVTRRNAATIINSTLLSRLFADGRAQPTFNGHDAFGDLYAPKAAIYKFHGLEPEAVMIDISMAAAASQAMAPLRSVEEMGYVGRQPWHVAAKLLQTRALLLQDVAPDDSVLGEFADPSGKGLKITYQELIQLAFNDTWWKAPDDFSADPYIPEQDRPLLNARAEPLKGSTALEALNFPLYFGLAIMAYEQTLISDQSPFDRFARGDTTAMSRRAIRGLEKFRSYGCADCHLQPEFAGSTVSAVFGDADPPDEEYEELSRKPPQLTRPLNPSNGGQFVEEMKPPELRRGLLQDTDRFFAYDGGFYNIGVTAIQWKDGNGTYRPEDWGVGNIPQADGEADFSRARQVFPGENLRQDDQSRVRGAFKTPSLRNIELTKPYMHNGAFLTLEDVMAFYKRGPREFENDHPDAKHWHHPTLPQLREHLSRDDDASADLVAFMKALTDERVRRHAAPFDHPSLQLPVGTKAPETVISPEEAVPQLVRQIRDVRKLVRQSSIAERLGSVGSNRREYSQILQQGLTENLQLKSETIDERSNELVRHFEEKLSKGKEINETSALKTAVSGALMEIPEIVKKGDLDEAAIVNQLVENRQVRKELFRLLEPGTNVELPRSEEPEEIIETLQGTGRNGSDDPLAGVSNWDNLPQ